MFVTWCVDIYMNGGFREECAGGYVLTSGLCMAMTFALTFLEKVCHMRTQRTDWVKKQNGCRRRDDDPLWNGQALPILGGKTPGELVRES